MSKIRGMAALGAALVWLTALVVAASACSCPPPPEDVKGEEQTMSWKFHKAEAIARGRITSLRAGQDVAMKNTRYVSANLRIASVPKGNVPTGDTEIVTLFGIGDCGIAPSLLTAIALDRDVVLELHKAPELPGGYVVDMCGYGMVMPIPTFEKPMPK